MKNESIEIVDPKIQTVEDFEEHLLKKFNPDDMLDELAYSANNIAGIFTGFKGTYQDLLNKVYNSEMIYINKRKEYEKKEVKLWFDNDLEETLGKKPTETDKKMHVKEGLNQLKVERDTAKARMDKYKRMFEVAMKYGIEVLR